MFLDPRDHLSPATSAGFPCEHSSSVELFSFDAVLFLKKKALRPNLLRHVCRLSAVVSPVESSLPVAATRDLLRCCACRTLFSTSMSATSVNIMAVVVNVVRHSVTSRLHSRSERMQSDPRAPTAAEHCRSCVFLWLQLCTLGAVSNDSHDIQSIERKTYTYSFAAAG